ncbi:hypothetical protein EWM64_g8929 [Hericium alpestre]|uniref:CN hydrolase domain-containing protein n=1 Tax=Hericium alpestre TaxID=135208 RepID=A0A4Y9ZM81_9AGAM|nr:hypothetical protein EWM64_g8929 [Hericium alpestre]
MSVPVNLSPSNSDTRKFKVAAVQAEPVWLDLQGSVDKTIQLVRDAAAQGAKIVGFPELFIPGYPWTIMANNWLEAADVLVKYQANSLAIYSPEMDRIRAAVREAGVWIVLGFSERSGGFLYISQVTIAPTGELANYRRKIKATQYEKTIFGDGNSNSLTDVVQTPYGRLGSFNCWEQLQPALKLHFYSQHPQLFVGSWPPAFPPGKGRVPWIATNEGFSSMSRSIAIEGGVFAIVSTQVVSQKGAEIMKIDTWPWFEFPGGGFATVYGPDGSQLTPPTDPGAETIVIAEISLDAIVINKLIADTMGNYSRHDLMHLVVTGSNGDPVQYVADVKPRVEEKEEALTVSTGEDVQ